METDRDRKTFLRVRVGERERKRKFEREVSTKQLKINPNDENLLATFGSFPQSLSFIES